GYQSWKSRGDSGGWEGGFAYCRIQRTRQENPVLEPVWARDGATNPTRFDPSVLWVGGNLGSNRAHRSCGLWASAYQPRICESGTRGGKNRNASGSTLSS